jgi:hypothetical protein
MYSVYQKAINLYFNASINQGIFPDNENSKNKALFSKRIIDMTVVITDLYPCYQFSKQKL